MQALGVDIPSSSYTKYEDNVVVFTSNVSQYKDKLISIRYKTSDIIPIFNFGSNTCSSQLSSSFGSGNASHGPSSFSQGEGNISSGYGSFASGFGNKALGNYSHAEGYQTTSYDNSHAEGQGTYAYDRSHAEGESTIANNTSHAEGLETHATGAYSHAEGDSCVASGPASHASGTGTLAQYSSQTAIGKWNAIDDNFAFIIGNGSDNSSRSNAFAVTWDGTPRGSKVQHNVGTTFTLSAGVIPGFVTNNTVVLTLAAERFLDTVYDITVSKLQGGLRGIQGFLDGSAYNTNWKTSAYTVSASILSRRHIEIRIEKNSGNFTNLVTNSPVAFYVNPTLTLNFS